MGTDQASHHERGVAGCERPLGAGLDAELERRPDGANLLNGLGHDGLSCPGGPLECEQAGRAGVSHRLHPALVPLTQRDRVEVVDAVPAAAWPALPACGPR